jgi:hypothetical protein
LESDAILPPLKATDTALAKATRPARAACSCGDNFAVLLDAPDATAVAFLASDADIINFCAVKSERCVENKNTKSCGCIEVVILVYSTSLPGPWPFDFIDYSV